jgi:hypothetical protein
MTRLAGLALLAGAILAACGGAASVPPAASAPAATGPVAESPTTAPVATPVGTAAPGTPAPTTPAGVDPAVVDAVDACSLLTAQEVAAAFGVPVDQVEPFPGGTALSGSRTCFYRPPGTADGQQVNLAVLATPDLSRPADPSPAPGLESAGGTWWADSLTGDIKLEVVAPDGVRLMLAYQDAPSPTPPTDAALSILVPLIQTALGRLP